MENSGVEFLYKPLWKESCICFFAYIHSRFHVSFKKKTKTKPFRLEEHFAAGWNVHPPKHTWNLKITLTLKQTDSSGFSIFGALKSQGKYPRLPGYQWPLAFWQVWEHHPRSFMLGCQDIHVFEKECWDIRYKTTEDVEKRQLVHRKFWLLRNSPSFGCFFGRTLQYVKKKTLIRGISCRYNIWYITVPGWVSNLPFFFR